MSVRTSIGPSIGLSRVFKENVNSSLFLKVNKEIQESLRLTVTIGLVRIKKLGGTRYCIERTLMLRCVFLQCISFYTLIIMTIDICIRFKPALICFFVAPLRAKVQMPCFIFPPWRRIPGECKQIVNLYLVPCWFSPGFSAFQILLNSEENR